MARTSPAMTTKSPYAIALALAGAGMLLALSACASQPAKVPATAATSAPANAVRFTAKPPASPNVATTFDVALVDPAGAPPAAQSAVAAIGQRIEACWRPPAAPDAPTVLLQLTLAEDGSVAAADTVEKKRFAAEPGYRAAATAATRAMFKCAPFALSATDYAAWKSLSLKLTPRHV